MIFFITLSSFASLAWAGESDDSIFANLPPDPDAAGKLTLAGIDSDNDGVRDDVQRWIVMNYPNSQKTRAALTQDVKVMQQFLLDAGNATKSRANAMRENRASICISYVREQILGIAGSDAYELKREMEAVYLNTYTRSKRWLQADAHLSGTFFSIPADSSMSCDFNPNLFPN